MRSVSIFYDSAPGNTCACQHPGQVIRQSGSIGEKEKWENGKNKRRIQLIQCLCLPIMSPAFRIRNRLCCARSAIPKPKTAKRIPHPPFAGYPLPNPLDKPLLWTWRGVWPLLILTQHLTCPALGQAILERSTDQPNTHHPPPPTGSCNGNVGMGDTCATLDSSHCRRLIAPHPGTARVQLLAKMQLT